MTRAKLAVALLLTLSFLAPAVSRAGDDSEGAVAMTTYYVGFLRKGPKWTPEQTPEVEKLQQEHLANIRRLGESGKLVLAGPFSDGGDLRGMFVFRVDSLEQARELCDSDPAVAAGRLIVELHPWYSATGIRSDYTPPGK